MESLEQRTLSSRPLGHEFLNAVSRAREEGLAGLKAIAVKLRQAGAENPHSLLSTLFVVDLLGYFTS